MLNEIKTSEQLDLYFVFEIMKHETRILDIKLNGYFNEVKKPERLFDWFMEDLIYFLDQNKFQRRWDYGKVVIHNIESLKLTEAQLNEFKEQFKTITSWDMELI